VSDEGGNDRVWGVLCGRNRAVAGCGSGAHGGSLMGDVRSQLSVSIQKYL
jgi:hypothetical protein